LFCLSTALSEGFTLRFGALVSFDERITAKLYYGSQFIGPCPRGLQGKRWP
jgi:hypothetical protein